MAKDLVPCLQCGQAVDADRNHWEFAGWDKFLGKWAARSRCINLKRGDSVAWFTHEADARQYVLLMNVINPNHNHS